MANFIIFMPDEGLAKGNGQIAVPYTSLNKKWDLVDDSLDSADIGDLFCRIESKETFYHVVSELWRCLKKNGPISINVPHPRHDLFLSNPEYTRAIIPETLEKFNSELNDKWKALGLTYPRLGHKFGVHFEISSMQMNADPYWQDLLEKQQIGSEDLNLASKQATNVVSHMQITWVARKEAAKKKNSNMQMTSDMISQFKEQIEMHKSKGNNDAAKLIEDLIQQAEVSL